MRAPLVVLLLALAVACEGRKRPWFCHDRDCPSFETASTIVDVQGRLLWRGGGAWAAAAELVTVRLSATASASLQVDKSADFSKRCYDKATWAASCSFDGEGWGVSGVPRDAIRSRLAWQFCSRSANQPQPLPRHRPACRVHAGRGAAGPRPGAQLHQGEGAASSDSYQLACLQRSKRIPHPHHKRRLPTPCATAQCSSLLPQENDLWGATPFATFVHMGLHNQAAWNATAPAGTSALLADGAGDSTEEFEAALAKAAGPALDSLHKVVCIAYYLPDQ